MIWHYNGCQTFGYTCNKTGSFHLSRRDDVLEMKSFFFLLRKNMSSNSTTPRKKEYQCFVVDKLRLFKSKIANDGDRNMILKSYHAW